MVTGDHFRTTYGLRREEDRYWLEDMEAEEG
jgi:hypothetical protein